MVLLVDIDCTLELLASFCSMVFQDLERSALRANRYAEDSIYENISQK